MNRIILSTTLTLAAVTPFALHGADVPENPNTIAAATPFVMHGEDLPENLNHLSFGARFGMNFKANFHNSAAYFNPVNPGPAAGGADHTYDDGYVLVDSSGNAGGLTWNWGYQNSSQVAGDTMQFHAIQPGSSSSTTGDPQYGAELTYQRVLGRLGSGGKGRWGLEAGFGFTDLDLRSNHRGTMPVITDTFPLNGVLPPGAGYNGTFVGPGALLGDTPTRTLESAALTSNQKLSGQMFTIRLGPFAEWNFTPKLSLAASAGLTLAPTTVNYDFSETVSLAGGGTYAAGGHSSKTELLYGPYVSGMLRYDFTPHWGVFVGAQFQSLTDMEQSIGSRTARLDPGATVYATMGITWSF